jgi:hypothetical protein
MRAEVAGSIRFKSIDIRDVKRIAFWDPKMDASSNTDRDVVVLIQEDEVFVTLEFPSREALRRFIDKVAAL